ncbi:MAG TPA: cytochrome c peroxidase [Verrucomicrobiae bacterium]|nr:cytochrome c peroxidase [Verrucomicrobiae bacterium]
MKATRPKILASHVAILLVASSISHATAATVVIPSPSSSLTLTQANGTASLSISNSGDQVWIMSSSTNLTSWSEIGSWKVHNGTYHASFTNSAGTPNTFYRAFYDPTRQTIFSTATNALLLPATSYNYSALTLPASFSQPAILAQDNMPSTNVTTDAGATLGRILFYDKRLSTNQTISCASCHQQANGFSDPRQFSVGYNGSLGSRNAMGLSNARWYQRKHFFWDERAATLEDQVLLPIQNPVEMGMTIEALTNRLAIEPFYTNLFATTFGSLGVTSDRVSKALAQFVRSIVSTRSRYDTGESNNFTSFTTQENLGRQIFNGSVGNATCAACHGTDNFTPGPALNNNGLEFPYVDQGVGAITGVSTDNGKFKVPSLRNIGLTAPYMHDGRFTNLAQVVEFYNSGVVFNPNLSPPLRAPGGNSALRLNLTTDQKAALVAFLNTLTDTNLVADVRFSDPFNYGN